ncbi:Ras- protein Rab-31 [Tritrichomonas musculus]|uniref:Ras- protein Rab-31 n=1 Tax=Tritrichomonas musculus TaxID=1915356 RepID=A0ABR2JKA3_9EUKA
MSTRVAKTVLVGDTGVGKSCIAKRAFTQNFDPTVAPGSTIGAEFYEGVINLDSNGNSIKFEIWDTAGQEAYRSLTPVFFKQSVIAIFVFDITNPKTLETLDYYVKALRDYEPNCFIAVVGNKIDLADDRKVSREEGQEYANKVGTEFYMETSAMTGEGINNLFEALANQKLNFSDVANKGVRLTDQNDKNEKKCC